VAIHEPATEPSIRECLLAIQGELRVDPDSRNRYDKPMVSIHHLEAQLGPLLHAHGLLTLWSVTDATAGATGIWRVRTTVSIMGPAGDDLQAEWWDTGPNPTAAAATAAKGFYTRLLHLETTDKDPEEK
jgi:hypothetical protein